jgi:hypothetical protein
MKKYEIAMQGAVFLKVTVTAPGGESRVRLGFVNREAAQKWVDMCQEKGEAQAGYFPKHTRAK